MRFQYNLIWTYFWGLKIKYPVGKISCYRSQKLILLICNFYREDNIGLVAQKWFSKLRNGNIDLENTLHSGRPVKFDEKHLNLKET